MLARTAKGMSEQAIQDLRNEMRLRLRETLRRNSEGLRRADDPRSAELLAGLRLAGPGLSAQVTRLASA